jgi:hypothetical protein
MLATVCCVPARHDEVEPAVAVEVAGGEAVPAAAAAGEPPLARHVTQPAGVVVEHAQRAPLARDDELRPPIAVEVREQRRRDEADGG